MASQALIKEFEDLLGKENVFSSEADRQSYSYDSAVLPPVVPAFALRPTTTEQLGICVKKLYDYGIPMTVRGAGTNLSGGTIPDSKESVVILTNGLNRILEINSDDLYAVVEPGVVTATFAAEVAKKNLFYPPDPGSQAVLKLVPPPQASKALMAVFDDMQKAAEAVAGIIAAHVVPCTLEFLDNNTIVRVDDYTKAGLPRDAAAILLIEVDGHPAQVADEAVVVERVLQQTGAVAVHVAKDAAEKFKLWEARRQALPVLARCKPTTVLEDATVPRSQIPAMMKAVNDIAKKYNVEVGTFGHAGDGNLHPTFLCDKRDKEEFARVEAAVDEMFDVAISLHGTLSGEHGIGTAKSKWMEKETSRGTILFSQRLRRALDPKGLLNPTKLVGI